MIELKNLSGGYGGEPKVSGVDLRFPEGEVTAIVGPNGCGKTTLLTMAAGLLSPYGGEVLLRRRNLSEIPRGELAKEVAFLPQSRNIRGITVRRLVMHGRFPYLGYPRRYRDEDRAIADRAIARVGLGDLADRSLASLSGGERQKAYLAMVLAQETGMIFLDEPTTYLDISCQLEIMTLVRTLAEQGRTVALVLHDLNLAMRHADRVAVMNEGRLRLTGTPEEIHKSGALAEVFGVRVGARDTELGRQYFFG